MFATKIRQDCEDCELFSLAEAEGTEEVIKKVTEST